MHYLFRLEIVFLLVWVYSYFLFDRIRDTNTCRESVLIIRDFSVMHYHGNIPVDEDKGKVVPVL
jgi:hypothetical protein